MNDLSEYPTGELHLKLALIMCDRMLFSFGAEIEAEMDAQAVQIEAEIARREAAASTELSAK